MKQPRELVNLAIDRSSREGLVQQIANGIQTQIERGVLSQGTKLPSVRKLAEQLCVSPFTAASAYDLLVARHVITARQGSGYFIPSRSPPPAPKTTVRQAPSRISDFWLALDVFAYGHSLALPGCGWLPAAWYREAGTLADALRRVARTEGEGLVGYGHPAGYGRLRQHLAWSLSEQQFSVGIDQLVLTNGATHALDLVARTFLKPGDAVLVEDPGYANLYGLLAQGGCVLLPVSRNGDGMDFNAVIRHCEEHRPKMMFVTTVLHNPLGTCLRQAETYRLLALAEKYDFLIVEDDVFRAFAPPSAPCLAALDGLQRVISISGFSKAFAPSLRIGYVASRIEFAEPLVRTKMLSGLTSSALSERLLFNCLSNPRQRRGIGRFSEKLWARQVIYRKMLEDAGLNLIAQPEGGMFVSAGWPIEPAESCDARTVAELALTHGIVLAPGCFFDVSPSRSIWFRFNVSHDDLEDLKRFLEKVPRHYGWTL